MKSILSAVPQWGTVFSGNSFVSRETGRLVTLCVHQLEERAFSQLPSRWTNPVRLVPESYDITAGAIARRVAELLNRVCLRQSPNRKPVTQVRIGRVYPLPVWSRDFASDLDACFPDSYRKIRRQLRRSILLDMAHFARVYGLTVERGHVEIVGARDLILYPSKETIMLTHGPDGKSRRRAHTS